MRKINHCSTLLFSRIVSQRTKYSAATAAVIKIHDVLCSFDGQRMFAKETASDTLGLLLLFNNAREINGKEMKKTDSIRNRRPTLSVKRAT